MHQDQTATQDRVPTSVQLARMLDRAEAEAAVSIGWLMEQLGGRSFGLALLVMGVLGIVPGISTVAALMVVWLAVQMMLGQEAAVLPGLVARRSIGVEKLARVVGFVAPRLAWVERLVQPRWPMLFQTTERLTGFMMLLLGLSMLLPVPFSQIVPAPVIMLLALAYLEEDGIALVLALIAALAALSITAATIWGTMRDGRLARPDVTSSLGARHSNSPSVIPTGARRAKWRDLLFVCRMNRSLRYASLRSAPVGMTESGSGALPAMSRAVITSQEIACPSDLRSSSDVTSEGELSCPTSNPSSSSSM